MPSSRIIQQFQKEIGVDRQEFLQALENARGSKSARITAFYRQLLNELIEELQAGDVNARSAERWLRNRIGEFEVSSELEETIFEALESDFNRVSRFLDERFDLLDRAYNIQEARIRARGNLRGYAVQGGRNIGNRLAVEIGALSQIYERDELYEMIREKLNITGHRVSTVTDNIIRGFDTEMVQNLAEQTGLELWRYEGTLVEHSRRFCRRLVRLGYVYTRPQIMQMDNGHGLNPFTFRGGYNCRHSWAPGQEGWPGYERPYPLGARFDAIPAEGGDTIIVVPAA